MRFSKIRILIVLTAVVGTFFAISAPSAMAMGQCGGAVGSWEGYYNNLQSYGAVHQAAEVNRSAGYSPTDGSFRQWLKERVVVTRITQSVSITNYGCNSSGLFGAGGKHLSKGWPVLVALPDKFSKSDVSMKHRKGYKAITISVRLVGQASCSNPGKAWVKIRIWVKQRVKRSTAPLRIHKIAEDPTGHRMTMPTGTFRFRVSARGYKPKTVTLEESTQIVGRYRVGVRVTVKEMTPLGNEKWKILSPRIQKQKVRARGNTFVFKNREMARKGHTPPPPAGNCNGDNVNNGNGSAGNCNVNVCVGQDVCNTTPPPCTTCGGCQVNCQPPPPPNRPPVVTINNPPQHVCSGETTSGGSATPGYVTLRVLASDPDGDNLGTPQVTAQRGTVGVPTKVADGQWTVRYTAPVASGTDTVTAVVSDGFDHNGDGQVNSADSVFTSITFANPKVNLDNPSPTTC